MLIQNGSIVRQSSRLTENRKNEFFHLPADVVASGHIIFTDRPRRQGDAWMLIEKFSRYVKSYHLTLTPRHKAASTLLIVDTPSKPSALKAIRKAIRNKQASKTQGNGDEVEILKAEHDDVRKVIVLLFHRARPHAPDPTYRKKVKETVSVRKALKDAGEEQSSSAHLIISTTPFAPGRYRAVLEEIPGLSYGIIMPLISRALREYPYDYKDSEGDAQATYTVIKSAGIKSHTIEGALKKGRLNLLTLVRPAPSDLADSEGIFKPKDQRIVVSINQSLKDPKILTRMENYIKNARKAGWKEFDVELEFEDERTRTVTIEREEEAKEILFVKATEVSVKNELDVCTVKVVDELVDKMHGVLKKAA